MSQVHKELLFQVFSALPATQRVAFLMEVSRTLGEAERRELQLFLENSRPADSAVAPPAAAIRQENLREGAGPHLPAQPQPRRFPDVNSAPVSSRPEEKGVADFHFVNLKQQGGSNTANEMRKQVVSCLGLFLLGALALIGLSVGGGKLFYRLLEML